MDMICETRYYPVGYEVCTNNGHDCNTHIDYYIAEKTCAEGPGGPIYYPYQPGGSPSRNPATDGGGNDNFDPTPPEMPKPREKIDNQINFRLFPCLKQGVDNAIDENFQSEIQTLILDIFGKSTEFNIDVEALELDEDTDGFCYPSIIDPDGNYALFTITLNTLREDSSQEYITATIFHEFLHAYLGFLRLPNVRYPQIEDHNEIANVYVAKLTKGLIDQYGIKKSHAEALSWEGLQESGGYESLSDSKKIFMSNMNVEYRNGTKGTKCD